MGIEILQRISKATTSKAKGFCSLAVDHANRSTESNSIRFNQNKIKGKRMYVDDKEPRFALFLNLCTYKYRFYIGACVQKLGSEQFMNYENFQEILFSVLVTKIIEEFKFSK